MNITTKANHRDTYVGDQATYQLVTKEDIWDISNLIKDINDRSLENIQEIYAFLNNEIKFTSDRTLAKEIQTFMSLIGYISDENQPSAGNGF